MELKYPSHFLNAASLLSCVPRVTLAATNTYIPFFDRYLGPLQYTPALLPAQQVIREDGAS
jgi:hypothetical protein